MLVGSLIALAGVYGAGVVRLWRKAGYGLGIRPLQALAFVCGWLALAVALSSPMDEWSETSQAVHMVQHEILMVVAAPLVAMSGAVIALLWAAPVTIRQPALKLIDREPLTSLWSTITSPLGAFLLYFLALWSWHMPMLYDAALNHESVHIVQHLCFFGTATLFWWGIVHGRYGRAGFGIAVVYLFATAVHSGVLGALLTFSPVVWYAPYLLRHTHGQTALEDQQLAGLLMWIPAGVVFVAGGLVLFAAWLRESDRHTRFKRTAPMGPS